MLEAWHILVFDSHYIPKVFSSTSFAEKNRPDNRHNPDFFSYCLAPHPTTTRQPKTEAETRLERASRLLTELKSAIAEGVELGEIDPRCLAQIEKIQITARQPLRKSSSGWLRHHTRKKQRKDGTFYEIPKRTHRGDPHEHPEDWYWNYQWRESGKVRSIYVAREKLSQVKSAIATNSTPAEIIRLIKGGQVNA